MTFQRILRFAATVGACESVGIAGSIFTARSIPEWYSGLNKPSFNPPSWVFAPVWTLLYALMGIALGIILEKRAKGRSAAIFIFGIQLILNFLWTLVFFGLRSPFGALIEIVALWIAIVLTILLFWKISHSAAIMLVPYLAWVSFASVLNWCIWSLNRA